MAVFKGLRFVSTLPEVKESNVIYFVRTSGDKANGTDGYLYFNGKKYGTAEDAKAALVAKYGDLKIATAEGGEKQVTIPEYVKSVLDAGAVTLEVQDSDKYLGVTSATTQGKGTVYTLASKAGAIEGAITSAVTDAKTVLVGNESTIDTIKYAEKLAKDADAAVTREKERAEGIEAGLRRDVDAKVKSVVGTDTVVATTTEHAVRVSLKTSDKGNVKFTQDTDGLSANVTIPAATVTGVKEGDKVLALDGTELTSTISLSVDTAAGEDGKKYIRLKGINGADLGKIDTADFVKDGMLQNAVYSTDTHKITLTFNTDAGDKVIELDLKDLVNVYKAGNGLALAPDGTFSINTDITATKESVDAVAGRVTTLEGKVGSAAVEGEGGAAATGLFKDVADNKAAIAAEAQTARAAETANAAAIATLNGDVNVTGSVDKKIKDALDKGAVTLEVKDTDAYLGVTSETIEGKGTVYTLASKEAEINKAIKTAADAVKVSVNSAEGAYVTGSVDAAGRVITLSEKTQAVAGAIDGKTGLAEASDVKAYVDGKVSDKNVSAEGESGETALVTASAAYNKVTVNATAKLKNAVAKAETSVQSVNGKDGAAVTLKATDIEVGAAVGQQAETATVNAVLVDIYTKLGVAVKADGKTIKEAADHTLSVNLETKTDQTVAAGHIALEHGEDGALYGVMYCLGDDAE